MDEMFSNMKKSALKNYFQIDVSAAASSDELGFLLALREVNSISPKVFQLLLILAFFINPFFIISRKVSIFLTDSLCEASKTKKYHVHTNSKQTTPYCSITSFLSCVQGYL